MKPSRLDWRREWYRLRDVPNVHLAINSGLPAWLRLALRRSLQSPPRAWFTLKVEP